MMHDGKWQQIKALFAEAIGLPPGERADWIERACGDDEALKSRVQSLVDSHAEANEFLREPTRGAEHGAPAHADLLGSSVGPYKLVELLGEGGFGSVYRAEQQAPVVRTVALKIIKLGMDTRQVIARFEAERQALAMMDHPNIARVLDAGATSEGRPYFVMELVHGLAITRYCDQHKLTISQRLELFLQVCLAVQHAHQKGIIHRDIKPSNVMVMLQDGRPVPKVIDFGIAKATNARPAEQTAFTELRQLIGTPEYMSPEQAGMTGIDIDTRSDIYSLGVLLYELLTGVTPFDSRTLRSAAYGEIQRIIREEDPPKPSTRLSTLGELASSVAAYRGTFPGRLGAAIKGDLDWVVMKALEKDRTRRYASAAELAGDVQRHLRDEPVLAGQPSRAYRVRKFVRRNRPAVTAAAAVMLVLVVGIVGTGLGLLWALEERDRAEANHQRAEESAALALEREEQTRKVADFQAAMLWRYDPQTMGEGMLREWSRHVEAGLRRQVLEGQDGLTRKLTEEEVAAGVEQFVRAAAPANPVDVARTIIHEGLLAPAVTAIEREFADQPQLEAALRTTVGRAYQELGMYALAEPLFRRALEMRREILGERHPVVAQSAAILAALLHDSGDYAAAEPLYRESLAIRRNALGSEHALTAETLNNLGDLLWAKGDYAGAELALREALTIIRRALGDEHPDVTRTSHNLAVLLITSGDYAAAEPLFRECLRTFRKQLGDEHPDVATTLITLASVLQARSDHAGAELLLRESLAIRRKVLGDDHPDVAMAQSHLARVLVDRGDRIQAESLIREALEIFRRVLGNDHPSVAMNLVNLGALQRDAGDPAGAESHFREALAIRRRSVGNDHPDTIKNLNGLAKTLLAKGDLHQAEQVALEGHALAVKRAGSLDAQSQRAVELLVSIYDARHAAEPDGGHDAEAAQWRAKLVREADPSPDSRDPK